MQQGPFAPRALPRFFATADLAVAVSMGSVDVTVNMVADVTGRGPPALEVLD
jgi:hypothetical protein